MFLDLSKQGDFLNEFYREINPFRSQGMTLHEP